MNYERELSSRTRGPKHPWFAVEYDYGEDLHLQDIDKLLAHKSGGKRRPTVDREGHRLMVWDNSDVKLRFGGSQVLARDNTKRCTKESGPIAEIIVDSTGDHIPLTAVGAWVSLPPHLHIGRQVRYVDYNSREAEHYKAIDRQPVSVGR